MSGTPEIPEIKVNGKLQQPNPDKAANGPNLSGMKIQVTALCKEPSSAEVLVEGQGYTEWVVEKVVTNTISDHV